ncbi:MAG TPA: thiolase domain-containing protein [Acidimicrobiia bacterium]|nr:thiolase domain-containing protein [Acidimicrobiia bacterium]
MRDVAIVSFTSSAVARDDDHNETEMLVPTVRGAIAESGIEKTDIGFVCSGSLDYLQGGPFAFVTGLDAFGAWPPVRESHVEMDAAWALYEAWVAIQTGEVDTALVYGFGKSSPGDLHEIMTLQTDPYYVLPLWPSMVDMAALQASAYLEASGRSEKDLAEVAARSQRDAQNNRNAIRKGNASVDDILAQPVTHHPLRDADIPPITDGTAAVILAAGDAARALTKNPVWIRGIEHRIEAHSLGVRDLAVSDSTTAAAQAAGANDGPVDVAELHAQFSHEELILTEAFGLNGNTKINPSGGPLQSNPVMSAGLIRIGEVVKRIAAGEAGRGIAHASSGPCLQQNMVVVLEGDK